MKEIRELILERLDIEKKEKITRLLNNCIKIGINAEKIEHATSDEVVFKMEQFFKGLPAALNEITKERKYAVTFHTIEVVLEELGLEIDQDECFILYHIRNLGKFRMKEDKLLAELKIEWKTHKEYAVDDVDFSRCLKRLMRAKIIDYRKRNLSLKQTLVLCYKF